jgi:hypothetical protein
LLEGDFTRFKLAESFRVAFNHFNFHAVKVSRDSQRSNNYFFLFEFFLKQEACQPYSVWLAIWRMA